MSNDITGAHKGDYIILCTLGAGGMGKVYKVRNTLTDRVEAMKVLLPDLSDQKDLADRFLREIKVLASLHDPNIAELRTALTIDNQLVMIIEYVEGITLAARLLQGPIRYADSLSYIDQILAALSYAHARQIVHRDIKPANMMLTPQGIVKLMDFGIARSGNDLGLTMTGTTLGSIAYMSPEQVRCEAIDARSDLYSVGVSLYEMITGQRPYVSDNNFEVMQAHLQVPPTPPIELKPDLPVVLSQLMLMAMAKDPAQRFQSADALRAALKSVAPSLGEPTPIAPIAPESQLDLTAPPTPRPVTAGVSRPITARPITAQPVAPLPVATPPAAAPPPVSAAPTPQLTPAPLVSPSPQYIVVTPAQAASGNRRGLFITLCALIVIAVLAGTGFAVSHFLHARTSDNSSFSSSNNSAPASAIPDSPAVAPLQPNSAQPSSSSNKKPAASLSGIPSSDPPASSHPKSPAPAPAPPPHSADPAPRPIPKQSPAEAEETSRTIIDSTAQLVVLERQELDELTTRTNSAITRVNQLQTQRQAQGFQLPADIFASQQRLQIYMTQAESSLKKSDVQTAQKFMDLATKEVSKLEKILGH
jgi:serine/threonine protein kinase